MDAAYVVKKPIVTEKSTSAMEEGRYTFEVDRRATKDDIKL
ncbi:MAG: 50S ribosomal protein L23, partial [Planctomycetota bacterium]